MGIHAGNPSRSARLTRVLEALRDWSSGLTTRDLIRIANVCAVNTCIAEIRAAGYAIDCEHEGTNEDGSRVYRYTLVSEPSEAVA